MEENRKRVEKLDDYVRLVVEEVYGRVFVFCYNVIVMKEINGRLFVFLLNIFLYKCLIWFM